MAKLVKAINNEYQIKGLSRKDLSIIITVLKKTPVSNYLFGTDLDNQLKELEEAHNNG